jgi:hypothetical protein
MKIGENYSGLVKFGDKTNIVRQGDVVGPYKIAHVNQSAVIVKKSTGEEVVWSISDH